MKNEFFGFDFERNKFILFFYFIPKCSKMCQKRMNLISGRVFKTENEVILVKSVSLMFDLGLVRLLIRLGLVVLNGNNGNCGIGKVTVVR